MIKLQRFKAKNFKNLKNCSIDFRKVNLINGNNGSGKSSILQGIQLLLTGSLPEKLSEYINWNSESFSLELDFEFNNKVWNYKYTYDGSSIRELKSGKEYYKGQDAVKFIGNLINSELLLYSSISEQGNSYTILLESPAKRLERFKSILGVDRLSRIIEIAKTEIKTKESQAEIMKKELEILRNKKFQYINLIDLPDIENIRKLLNVQENEKIISDNNDKLQFEYELNLRKYNEEINKKTNFESELKRYESLLSSYKEIQYDEIAHKELSLKQKEQDFLFLQYNQAKETYNKYVSNKENLLQAIQSDEKKRDEVKITRVRPLSFTDEQHQTTLKESIDLNIKLKELENHIQLVDNGKCPTCGQTFSTSKEELVKEKEIVNNEIVSLNTLLSQWKFEQTEYENTISRNASNRLIIESIEKNIQRHKESLTNLTEVVEPKEFVRVSYIDQLKEFDTYKIEYEKYCKETKTLKENIERISQQIKTIQTLTIPEVPIYAFNRFNKELYEEYKKQINIYETKLEEQKRIEQYNEKIRLEEIENRNIIKDKESLYYSLLGEIKTAEEAKIVLDKQFSSYLIDKGTKYVESKMNEFFQKCYPKYSVLFKQTDSKKSIDFYYTDNESGKIASAALCSGFEKQLLAMAFRIALSQITGIGFMILDEVDSDASADNSMSLYSNLIESQLFDQIITITHKDETKAHLENNYNANTISLV